MDIKNLQKKYKISDEDIDLYRYQPEILAMLEMDGFHNRYCKMIARTKSNEEAYNTTERQFFSYFGKNRFKNYETFSASLSRWLKNKHHDS